MTVLNSIPAAAFWVGGRHSLETARPRHLPLNRRCYRDPFAIAHHTALSAVDCAAEGSHSRRCTFCVGRPIAARSFLFGMGFEYRALEQSYQLDDSHHVVCSLMIFAGPSLCPLYCPVLCCDVLRRVLGWSTQMAMELGSPVGTFHGSALSLRRSGAMSSRLLSIYCIVRRAAL